MDHFEEAVLKKARYWLRKYERPDLSGWAGRERSVPAYRGTGPHKALK
jgi:hypothetical protein